MDIIGTLYWIGVALLCLLVFGFTYLYYTWPYSMFKNLGIPGPKPKPLVGTSSDFGKKSLHEIDRDHIAMYGKVVGTFEGWTPSLLITDVDMLKEIYIKDFGKFCDRPHMKMRGSLGSSVFDIHEEEPWKRQRTQLSKYFTAGKMRMSMKTLNGILDKFMTMLDKKYENKEMIEAKAIVNLYTMDVICTTAFGIETDAINHSDAEIISRAKDLFNIKINSINFLIFAFLPTLARVLDKFGVEVFDVKWFATFIKTLLKQRLQTKQECPDFVHTLLKAREEEHEVPFDEPHTKGMNDKEIIGNAVLFLLAGYDTTANSLSFLIYNLAVSQECQEKVYSEIQEIIGDKTPTYENIQQLNYLDMCLEESMRIYPIGVRIARMCMEDTVVKGIPIKKGVLATLPVWCIHHDPDIYPDPEKFDPERFNTENKKDRDPIHYCPFGVGPRHCIGMRLALLEMKLCIVRMLQKYKLKMNDKTQIPLQINKTAVTLTSQDGIWFSLKQR